VKQGYLHLSRRDRGGNEKTSWGREIGRGVVRVWPDWDTRTHASVPPNLTKCSLPPGAFHCSLASGLYKLYIPKPESPRPTSPQFSVVKLIHAKTTVPSNSNLNKLKRTSKRSRERARKQNQGSLSTTQCNATPHLNPAQHTAEIPQRPTMSDLANE
jgi:hypothetical protein